jgi:hypothetical protein
MADVKLRNIGAVAAPMRENLGDWKLRSSSEIFSVADPRVIDTRLCHQAGGQLWFCLEIRSGTAGGLDRLTCGRVTFSHPLVET